MYLTRILKDNTIKADLCEACAKAKKVDDPTGLSLFQDLKKMEMHKPKEKPKQSDLELDKQRQCDFCNYTQSRFKKTGRLGCSRCYEVFEEGLEQVFKSMHRGIRHMGKVPKKLQNAIELRKRKRALRSQLEVAIQKEDFEEAALIRDELKEIKKKMKD